MDQIYKDYFPFKIFVKLEDTEDYTRNNIRNELIYKRDKWKYEKNQLIRKCDVENYYFFVCETRETPGIVDNDHDDYRCPLQWRPEGECKEVKKSVENCFIFYTELKSWNSLYPLKCSLFSSVFIMPNNSVIKYTVLCNTNDSVDSVKEIRKKNQTSTGKQKAVSNIKRNNK